MMPKLFFDYVGHGRQRQAQRLSVLDHRAHRSDRSALTAPWRAVDVAGPGVEIVRLPGGHPPDHQRAAEGPGVYDHRLRERPSRAAPLRIDAPGNGSASCRTVGRGGQAVCVREPRVWCHPTGILPRASAAPSGAEKGEMIRSCGGRAATLSPRLPGRSWARP